MPFNPELRYVSEDGYVSILSNGWLKNKKNMESNYGCSAYISLYVFDISLYRTLCIPFFCCHIPQASPQNKKKQNDICFMVMTMQD